MSYRSRFQQTIRTITLFFQNGIVVPRWAQGIGVRLTLVLALVGISLGYVLQISQTAVSGYEIHSLESEVATLNNDNKDLSVNIAQYSALSSIHERLSGTHMVQVSKVNYLSLDDATAVAQK